MGKKMPKNKERKCWFDGGIETYSGDRKRL